MKELSKKELASINGGYWGLVLKVGSAILAGFSVGYGWGSHECECENEVPDMREMGPTHLIA